MKTMKIILASL